MGKVVKPGTGSADFTLGELGIADVTGLQTALNAKLSAVLPTDLTATNAPTDGQVPTYDIATGNFTWVAGGGGGGASDADIVLVQLKTHFAINAGNSSTEHYFVIDGNPANTDTLVGA